MRALLIILTFLFFSTTSGNSKEVANCKDLKKFSLKGAMCKTKAAGGAIKAKLSKKKMSKKESGEKSIFKKFNSVAIV